MKFKILDLNNTASRMKPIVHEGTIQNAEGLKKFLERSMPSGKFEIREVAEE